MQHVSLESYKSFVVYCLQYKSLIIEQLSEAKEREFLELHNGNPPETENGYGIILQCTIIRCLKGMSMEFLGMETSLSVSPSHQSSQVATPRRF
jgi:hypothetical protein